MSNSKPILLRVQSSDGTKRIEIGATASLTELYETIFQAFNYTDYGFGVFLERSHSKELPSSRTKNLTDLNIKHGDMVYIKNIPGSLASTSSSELKSTPTPSCLPVVSSMKPANPSGEDEVDVQLAKVDGTIKRNRDPKLCRHNSNGCCVHCSPIEPWDESYLKEQKIKHLSFHAYIRKLTSGVDRGKFVALEDISCRIKSGCGDHPPWPKGICSKCQPSAITLNRQIYRHVDNVMFENTALVERFLNYWRTTGHQRLGYLYGTYEVNNAVPLGMT
jgi:nuclear protein localization family protein 4